MSFATGSDAGRQHVFIIGSKGIPASYGGFETFVENLTRNKKSKRISYHVACMASEPYCREYNGARCFGVTVLPIGAAKAVFYDLKALSMSIRYCRNHPEIERPVFYILACRIGPFIRWYKRKIRKLDGVLYLNPDGHEWKRKKWNFLIRCYWKISEKGMVKNADLVICDSRCIEQYIQDSYRKYQPDTTYISYGAELGLGASAEADHRYAAWLEQNHLKAGEYYLIVGRFVPENNFNTIIREFMESKTARSLAVITTEDEKFRKELEKELGFKNDSRIRFTGTVYDSELLKRIRSGAYAYLHGHEVGGTNPSLLEALGCTDVNLLLHVGFNREVAGNAAFYWNKQKGNLCALIERTEKLTRDEISRAGEKAKKRIWDYYQWDKIVLEYENIFEKAGEDR